MNGLSHDDEQVDRDRTKQLPTMTSIEAADTYFADCVRNSLAGETLPDWPDGWSGVETERMVTQRSEFHGIAVLLSQTKNAFHDWPDSVSDSLREEARLAALWEATHQLALTALLAQLADAGMNATVMKGTALAYLYYEVPAMRRRGDTDLLVRPEDAQATRRILQDAGYSRRNDPHGLYFQETWILNLGADLDHSIDLHWEPADRPLLQRILTNHEFLHNSQPIPQLGLQVRAPSAMLMLVHGAINQAWHVARGFYVDGAKILGGRRLIWSVDYAHLTRDFSSDEWEDLVRFCEQRDACSIVYSALSGAQQDIGLHVPASIMDRLKQDQAESPTHRYIANPDSISDAQTDLLAAGTASARLRILAMAAFSPRDHLVGKYPHLSHWPTFALQLRRYAGMGRRLFKRAESS